MTHQHSDLGQDSFLDIVANLVGILIILVVVVGAQAASVWKPPASTAEQSGEIERLELDAERKRIEFTSLQYENKEIHRKLAEENAISNRLTNVRRQLLLSLESARREVEQRMAMLDGEKQASLIAATQVEALRQQIEQVRFEAAATQQHLTQKVEKIEHYPTPIARTVFSDEIHFRILDGRIVHVPLEQLVSILKNQLRAKAQQTLDAENTSGTVGPVEDFRLQYSLDVIQHEQIPSKYGIQLKRFYLQPTSAQPGEEIELALREGSGFRSRVSRMVPRKTTVSIWVYPGDYENLAKVRGWLRYAGFQTASWPLEYGSLISGGPQGFRTTTN